MNASSAINTGRWLQLLGIVMALTGLVGSWLDRRPDAVVRTEAEVRLMNPNREAFQASFVVVGRDYDYDRPAGPVLRDARGAVVGRTRPASGARYASTTDSMFFVSVTGDRVYWIGLPRDIWLDEYDVKLNSLYQIAGAEGLRRKVVELLSVPVDFYVVVGMEVFTRAVDLLGGVDVHVTEEMVYTDHAAGLHIDFGVGHHRLSGEDAAAYVRYRGGAGNDLGRIDNLKRLGAGMLARAKELHVRAALLVPDLIDIALTEVETNVDLETVRQLAIRLPQLELQAATVPVRDVERVLRDRNLGLIPTQALVIDPYEVEQFLADFFGGEAREVLSIPDVRLLVTNRSGTAGLAERLEQVLVRMGIPEADVATREGGVDHLPTRVQLSEPFWEEAGFFATLLHAQPFQVFRLDAPGGVMPDVEIVLGEEAAAFWGLRAWDER